MIKNCRTAWSTINDKIEKVGERGEFVESKALNPTVGSQFLDRVYVLVIKFLCKYTHVQL